MDRKLFDHTILKADATRADVERVCREAAQYGFMSVCVNRDRKRVVKGKSEDHD